MGRPNVIKNQRGASKIPSRVFCVPKPLVGGFGCDKLVFYGIRKALRSKPDRLRLLFMKNLTLSLSVMSRKTPIQVYYSKMAINISNDLDKRDRFYCDKYTNM